MVYPKLKWIFVVICNTGDGILFKNHLDFKEDQVIFNSISGELIVKFDEDYMQMDFPHRKPINSITKKYYGFFKHKTK